MRAGSDLVKMKTAQADFQSTGTLNLYVFSEDKRPGTLTKIKVSHVNRQTDRAWILFRKASTATQQAFSVLLSLPPD